MVRILVTLENKWQAQEWLNDPVYERAFKLEKLANSKEFALLTMRFTAKRPKQRHKKKQFQRVGQSLNAVGLTGKWKLIGW